MRKEQLRNGVSIPALLGVGIVLGSISLLEAQKHSPVEWSVNDVARVKATEPTFHVDEEIGLSTATTLISLDDGQFLYGGYKGWWKPQ
jgi:hypothetical protein